jgi:hypothetical protein
VNYLSGGTPQANVGILWVVMKWLVRVGSTSYADLRSALRPPSITPGADMALTASLSVGRHIGLLDASDSTDGPWSVGPHYGEAVKDLKDYRSFRSLVRQALLTQAVRDVEEDRAPADVAIGLTWLCSLDPAKPLPWGWDGDDGSELIVREAGMSGVISNAAQWRPFRRWAVALGMAVRSTPSKSRRHTLSPDPTAAIEESLSDLSRSHTAPKFLAELAGLIPAIDTGRLETATRELGVSYAARGDATIGPAVGYALQRLNRRGRLTLRKSDDATHRVSYRLAHTTETFDDVIVTRTSGG